MLHLGEWDRKHSVQCRIQADARAVVLIEAKQQPGGSHGPLCLQLQLLSVHNQRDRLVVAARLVPGARRLDGVDVKFLIA